MFYNDVKFKYRKGVAKMDTTMKIEVADRVAAHLRKIRLIIDEIHDEFNPDEFEELASEVTELDLANESAINFCQRF